MAIDFHTESGLYCSFNIRDSAPPLKMGRIGIGLAGLGNVGAGVYKHLIQNRAIIGERLGLELGVHRVAVKNPEKNRVVSPPPGIITRNWEELIEDLYQ